MSTLPAASSYSSAVAYLDFVRVATRSFSKVSRSRSPLACLLGFIFFGEVLMISDSSVGSGLRKNSLASSTF